MVTINKLLLNLENSGLIQLAQTHPELEYLFRHALVQDAAYESLLIADRKQLHRQVAETLEYLYSDRLDELAPILGDHFAKAGEAEKAILYFLQAGDQARGRYAHQEAINAYQLALELLQERDDHERTARTLMKLGLMYHNIFDFQQARQAYKEGFALWQQASHVAQITPPAAPHPLRLAVGLDHIAIDPAFATFTDSSIVINQLFSGLVGESPELEVVPEITQSWEVLENGTKYIFHLRDDVTWSDGTPVTAADFEYAWKRILNPATESPNANLLYDIKGAEAFHRGEVTTPDDVGVFAVDDTTLTVELKHPASYFLQLLTHSSTFAIPRHIIESYGQAWTSAQNIATNGPYKLEDQPFKNRLSLVRNPNYYGRFNGNVEQVEVSFFKTVSTLLEEYLADGIDILSTNMFSAVEMDAIHQKHPGDHMFLPEVSTIYFGFNNNKPPFNDVRVRRAFVMATDRERWANEIENGFGSPATGGFVPPGIPGYSAGIGLLYDPEQARQFLAKAGYPEGRGFPNVNLMVPDVPRAVSQCEYLQKQWQENLGITVIWQTVDWTLFFEKLINEPPHAFISGWAADYPDPDNFLRVGIPHALYFWQNNSYNQLLKKAGQVVDQQTRLRLYRQADKMLIEEAILMPLYYEGTRLIVKPWLSRFAVSPNMMWFLKDAIIEPH